ncbi:MAG TPA: CaiB/BaiF CoA-transferase family protein [Candidatus Binataceae bacterium]|nr:CaiB/BaiF CoA-transferase family protein [Candidatus Binataceae bacterium]
MPSKLLNGFRMLDLTDEKGALCGKMFADLGAEVIKVEPPEGCSTRRIPPYIDDIPDPDRCLYSIAYHAGKKSVTANLASAEGRALVTDLAAKADFLVESYPVGHLDSIGLGHDALAARNPRLIYTSITPFGDTGPGKNYQWADIVSWAAGGAMYLMGEEGKPPLQMSLPQAGLHAGGEAAVASMIAHYPRQIDGLGQKIVVNMQACIVWTLMNEQAMPFLHGNHLARSGAYAGSTGAQRKMVYECKDGHISILVAGGTTFAPSTRALIGWMGESGYGSEWMRQKEWTIWVPGVFMAMTEQDRQEIAELEETIGRFFATMTKSEIYAQALKRRILLAPVATAADIDRDEHLKARDFWVDVPHDTIGRTLVFPGPFAKMTATPIGGSTRAPRIGEHNDEIYRGVLGLSPQRIQELCGGGAI